MFKIEDGFNGGINVMQEQKYDFPGLPPVLYNVLFIEKENVEEFLQTIQEYINAQ